MPGESPSGAARLTSLTGLRFLAALTVFAWHVRPLLPVGQSLADPLFVGGQAGVSFFFMLSGFVLTWSHRPDDSARPFWRRRAARILPSHLVTWLVAIPVAALTFGAWPPMLPRLATLTLTQAWVPSSPFYFGVNGVSWSLACEAFFYALFPLLVRPALRMTTRTRLATMAGCVVALAIVQLGVLAVSGAHGVVDENGIAFWLVYILPVGRLPEFLLGVLVAADVRAGRRWDVGVLPAAIMACAALYVAGSFPRATVAGWVTAVPFLLLITSCAAADVDGRGAFFARRTMVRLGEWSFAFYLTHQLVIRVIGRAWGARGLRPVEIVLDLLVAIGASALLYSLVERPAQRWLRTAPRRVLANR